MRSPWAAGRETAGAVAPGRAAGSCRSRLCTMVTGPVASPGRRPELPDCHRRRPVPLTVRVNKTQLLSVLVGMSAIPHPGTSMSMTTQLEQTRSGVDRSWRNLTREAGPVRPRRRCPDWGGSHPGAVQISANGRFLIATDADSNQVWVLQIKHDGLLSSRDGVASSGGVLCPSASRSTMTWCMSPTPVNGGSNYTGFRLGHGGRRSRSSARAVALPDGSQPGDVLFNGNGTIPAQISCRLPARSHGRAGRRDHCCAEPFRARGGAARA